MKLIQHKKVFKRTFKQGHKMIFNSKDENAKKANFHLLMFLKIQFSLKQAIPDPIFIDSLLFDKKLFVGGKLLG